MKLLCRSSRSYLGFPIFACRAHEHFLADRTQCESSIQRRYLQVRSLLHGHLQPFICVPSCAHTLICSHRLHEVRAQLSNLPLDALVSLANCASRLLRRSLQASPQDDSCSYCCRRFLLTLLKLLLQEVEILTRLATPELPHSPQDRDLFQLFSTGSSWRIRQTHQQRLLHASDAKYTPRRS